jgi:DNA-3-methyladenine glycosylase
MYSPGGNAYVYLCYGVHSLFNVVTNTEGIPHAILIRGINPAEGIAAMLKRAGKSKFDRFSGTGPGKVTKLLGIHYSMTGKDLTDMNPGREGVRIWIEDRGIKVDPAMIKATPRIGVEYAGEDAKLPYRFIATFALNTEAISEHETAS